MLSALRAGFPDWSARLGEDLVVGIDAIGALSNTALTRDVEMKMRRAAAQFFVPGRNIIFLAFAAALAYRRGLKHIVTGVCETDYSGYPDCRDDTIKAMQVALNLGLERRFVLETPLMWIDKPRTFAMARELGGQALSRSRAGGKPFLLHGRPDACARLGQGLRRLPGLQPARGGVGQVCC